MICCAFCAKPTKVGICPDHAKEADALFLKPPWTKFSPGNLHHDIIQEGFQEVWVNSRYQVYVRNFDGPVGPMKHLSIKRLDKLPIHDWRDLQRIKNEILGPEEEAVELYPAERRLVDSANQYHLFCFIGKEAPFGYTTRLVGEGSSGGAIQRPFEKDVRPDDVMDSAELDRMIVERRKQAGL